MYICHFHLSSDPRSVACRQKYVVCHLPCVICPPLTAVCPPSRCAGRAGRRAAGTEGRSARLAGAEGWSARLAGRQSVPSDGHVGRMTATVSCHPSAAGAPSAETTGLIVTPATPKLAQRGSAARRRSGGTRRSTAAQRLAGDERAAAPSERPGRHQLRSESNRGSAEN